MHTGYVIFLILYEQIKPIISFNLLNVTSFSVISLFSHCIFIDSAIVNGVYWSEALNKVFVDNFERDPSLIWQYFGSAKGFFRQYPGKCVLFFWVLFWFLKEETHQTGTKKLGEFI